MVFEDREEAGVLLYEKLSFFLKEKNTLILAIPRGGVVLGKIVSDRSKVSLDILVVKKIGAPNNQELAIGAVTSAGTVYWDRELIRELGITNREKELLRESKIEELKEREKTLRGNKAQTQIKGKTVILVDDGVATGSTVIAAAKYLRKKQAKKIILAVPVISKETLKTIVDYFDDIIVLSIEKNFQAVGQFYQYFPQVTDEEVIKILNS